MDAKLLVDEWLKNLTVGKYTATIYLNQVNLFFKMFSEFSVENLEKFLIDGMQKRVYIRKFAMLSFVRFLEKKGLIKKEEYERVFKGYRYKLYDRREMQTLLYRELVELIKNIKNEKLRVILMILFDSGARIRAVLQLRKDDVKIYDNIVNIYLKEKGQKTVERRITPETYIHWHNLIQKTQFLYPFLDKNQISLKDLQQKYYEYWKLLQRESKRILRKNISFHWVRRCAGNYWYEKTGHNLLAVQDFYSHSDSKVTVKYLKMSGEIIKKMYSKEKRPW